MPDFNIDDKVQVTIVLDDGSLKSITGQVVDVSQHGFIKVREGGTENIFWYQDDWCKKIEKVPVPV